MRRAFLATKPVLILAGCGGLVAAPSPVAEAPLRVHESASIRRA